MWCGICAIIAVAFSLSVNGFDDPISVIGRIRYNYTSYEENLWTRLFKNTTLEQIYRDHSVFIDSINKIYDGTDNFYPSKMVTNSTTKVSMNGTHSVNPFHVPEIESVIDSIANVAVLWSKFSDWSSLNASNKLEELTIEAIPILQTSLGTLWNSTNTAVYFDFLNNVRHRN